MNADNRHYRESGDPKAEATNLDSRLRGNDGVHYLTLEEAE